MGFVKSGKNPRFHIFTFIEVKMDRFIIWVKSIIRKKEQIQRIKVIDIYYYLFNGLA